MNKLIETLKNKNATVNDFLNCLEEIKAFGDIFILYVDSKKNKTYTAITCLSLNKKRICHEGSDVKDMLIQTLQEYVSVRGLDQ